MLVSYSCIHTTIEQEHPPILSWNMFFFNKKNLGEKSAKGSRKVGERRVCQDPTLAQNGLVCLAMLPLQIPFKVFSICVSVVGQSVKRLRRMRPLVLNTILVFFIRNYAHEHDHNFLSRFCWGAKGRESFAKGRRKGSFGVS